MSKCGWISTTKDRFPSNDEMGPFLVVHKHPCMSYSVIHLWGFMASKGWGPGGVPHEQITHWKNLPPLPKEREDDE